MVKAMRLPVNGEAPRAAVYVRSATGSEGAMEQQIQECEKWAAANGVDVRMRCVDRGRCEALHRPGLTELRQALAIGDIDVVIVSSIDRLFRNSAKTVAFIEDEIVARGLRCVCAAREIVYS